MSFKVEKDIPVRGRFTSPFCEALFWQRSKRHNQIQDMEESIMIPTPIIITSIAAFVFLIVAFLIIDWLNNQ